MPMDQFGNYVTGLNSALIYPTPVIGTVVYGSGAPSGSPLTFQTIYVDETNNQLYLNVSGVWTLQTGGGGGGGVSQGNYGGGVPPFTPASGAGIAIDNSNGREWAYWGGGWH